MQTKYMRPGGDKRGSNRDRAARKRWMLAHFGDGTHAPCTHCAEPLCYDTIEADRIIPGGSYRRDNVQPSCRRCNAQRSDNPHWTFSAATVAA